MIDPLLAEALWTPEEYLAVEETAEVKHEYVGGRVYAFAGAGWNHNVLVSNLHFLLRSQLGSGPCLVLGSDMMLKAAEDVFYYPDLLVCCDPTDTGPRYVRRPRVVIEVLSPSTRRTDLTEKAAAYWRVPSIEVYLIVDPDAQRVQVLRRGSETWQIELLSQPEHHVRLESLGFAASLAEIYERTTTDGTG